MGAAAVGSATGTNAGTLGSTVLNVTTTGTASPLFVTVTQTGNVTPAGFPAIQFTSGLTWNPTEGTQTTTLSTLFNATTLASATSSVGAFVGDVDVVANPGGAFSVTNRYEINAPGASQAQYTIGLTAVAVPGPVAGAALRRCLVWQAFTSSGAGATPDPKSLRVGGDQNSPFPPWRQTRRAKQGGPSGSPFSFADAFPVMFGGVAPVLMPRQARASAKQLYSAGVGPSCAMVLRALPDPQTTDGNGRGRDGGRVSRRHAARGRIAAAYRSSFHDFTCWPFAGRSRSLR